MPALAELLLPYIALHTSAVYVTLILSVYLGWLPLQHCTKGVAIWRPVHIALWSTRLVKTLGRHVQWRVMRLRSRVQSSVPGTSAFHQKIISNNSYAHDEQGDNPEQEKGFDCVIYNLWPLLTPWVAASRLLATSAWLKLKGVTGHWLVQHTAPVRAKPDGRPRLEGVHCKYLTSCLFPTYLSLTLHIMHTLAHTYQFPFCPWASALDHYEVSALRSRVGWTSAHNNEWTNERCCLNVIVVSCLTLKA